MKYSSKRKRNAFNSLTTVALVVAGSGSLPTVRAWGFVGHEIVATIAQMHLHPSVFDNICTILNYTSPQYPEQPLCHLAPVSTWADKNRMQMRWSSSLHYIGAIDDHPSQTCAFPGDKGWAGKQGGNVLEGVRNVTSLLEGWAVTHNPSNTGDNLGEHGSPAALAAELARVTKARITSEGAANEALKFLIHFLGDMHMPLHLTGRDRGGNSDKVMWGNRVSNLHAVWDGLIINKAISQVPRKYHEPLNVPQIEYSLRKMTYDPYVRQIMAEGLLGKWKDDIESWLYCPGPSPPDSSMGPLSSSSLNSYLSWTQRMLSSTWERVLDLTGETEGGISIDTDDELLCPYYWASSIHKLNCDIIWPRELDEPPYTHDEQYDQDDTPSYSDSDAETNAGRGRPGRRPPPNRNPPPEQPKYIQLDTPEYAGAVTERWIIEKLLAQGGIRLAAVLNHLFASEEGPEESIDSIGGVVYGKRDGLFVVRPVAQDS